METIKYKIIFHTEWHCGSGLAAGADLDSLVVKDENGMPYVPGKTIKGLVREASFDLLSLRAQFEETVFNSAFGESPKEKDGELEEETFSGLTKRSMFFGNATLETSEYNAIVNNNVQRFLFRKKTSTAIDNTGVAKKHSLRSIQTVVPMTLIGEIIDVPNQIKEAIVESFGLIKNMGQGRNRGLGRCSFVEIVEGGNK